MHLLLHHLVYISSIIDGGELGATRLLKYLLLLEIEVSNESCIVKVAGRFEEIFLRFDSLLLISLHEFDAFLLTESVD